LKVIANADDSCKPEGLFCRLGKFTYIWSPEAVVICPYYLVKIASFCKINNVFTNNELFFETREVVNICDKFNAYSTNEGLFLASASDTNSSQLRLVEPNINEIKSLLIADLDRKTFNLMSIIEHLNIQINKKLCILLAASIDSHKRLGCSAHIPVRFNTSEIISFGYLTQNGIIRKDSINFLCNTTVRIELIPDKRQLSYKNNKVTLEHQERQQFNFYHVLDQKEPLYSHDKTVMIHLNEKVEIDITNELKLRLTNPDLFKNDEPNTVSQSALNVGNKIKEVTSSIGKSLGNFVNNIERFLAFMCLVLIIMTLIILSVYCAWKLRFKTTSQLQIFDTSWNINDRDRINIALLNVTDDTVQTDAKESTDLLSEEIGSMSNQPVSLQIDCLSSLRKNYESARRRSMALKLDTNSE